MTMTGIRATAAVVIGVFLATGIVRGAGTQFGALRNKAKKALETGASKKDVAVDDDDESGTPTMALAAIADLAPGSDAEFSVSGSFGAKTKFAMAGRGFTMTTRSSGKGTFEGTVHAAPDTLPGAAVLRATNRHGTGEAPVAYVTGTWLIEGTTDNGWRVRLSPAASTRRGVLAFRGEFFDGAAKAPFTTREAKITLGAQTADTSSYVVSLAPLNAMAGLGDAECDPVMARAHELADQLMKAKNQAEEDKVSAEIDKIQDKIDTCVEKQQDNAGKAAAKMNAAARQAETDAKKFGCETLALSVAADGAAQGTFTCTTGSPAFTGTMKPAGR